MRTAGYTAKKGHTAKKDSNGTKMRQNTGDRVRESSQGIRFYVR
jgi:hypothetical protein